MIYKFLFYDTPIEDYNVYWDAYLKPMFLMETGLPLEYFDTLTLKQVGDLLGYLTEKARADKKRAK